MSKFRLKRKYRISIAIALFLFLIFLVIFCIDLIRYNLYVSNYNETYMLEINSNSIEPTFVEGKEFIFHEVKGEEAAIKVPKNSKVNLQKKDKIIDSAGNEISGNVDYLPDGKYTVIVKRDEFKYTYKLNVDNDFYVEVDDLNSYSAGYLVVDFYDLNKSEDVSIECSFKTSELQNFKVEDMIIPIDYNNDAGNYKIDFSSKKSKYTSEIVLKDYTYRESRFNVAEDVISDSEDTPDSKVQKSYDDANNLITDKIYYAESGFVNPSVGSTTGDFGDVRFINGATTPTKIHYGIDYANKLNTNIFSSAKGKVAFVGFLPKYGNVIVIDHGNGITSHYFHLEKTFVNVGDEVDSSVVIAGMGTTGYSTGVHLHFEIHINGIVTNPYFWLS